MPISSNIRKAGPYTGTGLVTTYPFYFKVFQAADLYVVRADTADVETVLVLNTDYTVSLNADQDVSPGGNVVLTTALESGHALVITSSIENLQPTDLTNMGGFYPSVITDALDRACIQIQQVSESTDRAIKAPITTPTDVDMQLPVPSADKVLGWDNTGTAIRNYSLAELATSVAYGDAAIDKFTGNGSQTVFTLSSNPASQNNLYISVGGVVQNPDVDYVWTSGTTLTFTTAPPSGTVVLVRYMVALAQGDVADNSITTAKIADSNVTPAKLSAGAPSWDMNGNVGIGEIPNSQYKFQVGTGNWCLHSDVGQLIFESNGRSNRWWLAANINDSTNDGVYIGTGGNGISTGTKIVKILNDTTHISPNGGLGYGIGAGGTVTQSTSKYTAVTLNKPCGQITTNNTALAAGQEIGFDVNNSTMTTHDTVIVNTVFGGNYAVRAVTAAGLFYCYVKNISAGSLSEAVVINFAIIKGATS